MSDIFLCSALWCQGDIKDHNLSPLLCVRVNKKKGKGRARFVACFSSIVKYFRASCSREFPKFSYPHLPPDPVSEHFSSLFSKKLLLPVDLIC